MSRLSLRCWTMMLGLVCLTSASAQSGAVLSLGDTPSATGHGPLRPMQATAGSLIANQPDRGPAASPTANLVQDTPQAEVQEALAELNRPLAATALIVDATRALELKTEAGASQTGVDPLYRNYTLTSLVAEPSRGGGTWQNHCKTWQSPNLGWNPLYFEEENVERYGFHAGHFQAMRSGAHFFGSAALLPCKICTDRPHSCVYGLGYERPGGCNPAVGHPRKFHARALNSSGLATGW